MGRQRGKCLRSILGLLAALLCPLVELYCVHSLQTIHKLAQLTLPTQVQASAIAHQIKPAQNPLVYVVASNCCTHGIFEHSHFSKKQSALMIRLQSNVLSEYLNIRHYCQSSPFQL